MIMVQGSNLELQDYCSHCGDFEPDVLKIETTGYCDKIKSYYTTIKCVNADKCARIKENLEKRL